MPLADLTLPPALELTRTTPEFTVETVPSGLLRAHRLAPNVWGHLRVLAGALTFVLETTGESRHLTIGEAQVVEPDVPHHVEPGPDAVFVVDFYKPTSTP